MRPAPESPRGARTYRLPGKVCHKGVPAFCGAQAPEGGKPRVKDFAMGLRQFLGLGGPLSARRIEKSAKLAANPFAQPDVRSREMQRLLKDESPQALRGVLKRFSANAQGHIADEEEKRWLSDALAEVGEHAQAPLEDYIRTEDKLTYALGTYRRIVGAEGAVRFFCLVLREIGPADYRRIEAKLQLVLELSEQDATEEVARTLTEHLHDHSDDVRWSVLEWAEALGKRDDLSEAVRGQLARHLGQLVCEPQVSMRIAQRAAQMLSNLAWQLPAEVGTLNPALENSFFLDKKHHVRPRASA